MTKAVRNLLIALAAGTLIYFFLPAANGLTPKGVAMLAVFLPTIFLWLACGTGWPSLLSVTLAIMLGAVPGVPSYMTMWGNVCAAAVIPFLMVGSVLEESGCFEWLVKWIISREFIHGRPTLFMIMLVISMVVISVFTAPQVVAVLFFKLLTEVAYSIGYTREDSFYKSNGLLIGWISQICDGVLIWGRPHVITLTAVIVGLGYGSFTTGDYLKFSGLYLLVACVAAVLIVKLWMRPDVSKFASFDSAAMRAQLKENPLSRKAKIALAGMVVILVSYLLATLTFLGPVASYFSGISIAAPVTLVCALLCVIPVDGQPVMDLNKAASKVPWSMIIFLGAVMFYAGNLGGEDYGISLCLQNLLGPVVSSIPTSVAIAIGITTACVITNFCSNTVAGVVTCSSFVPALLMVPGINPAQVLAFASAVVAICGTAICTVSACPTMGIVYSDIGVPYKGTAKYSVVLCAIMVLVSAFILVPVVTGMLGAAAVLG